MLSALNTRRRRRSLAPLDVSPVLSQTAAGHAASLAESGRLSHLGPNGLGPAARARATGYEGRALGELLARHAGSEIALLAAWLDDADARAVLLDPEARVMGLGLSVSAIDATAPAWVLLTGRPGDTDAP